MSSWTKITFDPGERDPEAVEADLREAIRTADESICRSSEQDDPDTDVENGRVTWYLYGFEGADTFDALDVPCRRALAINLNDTAGGGVSYLFEWVDGRFLHTDTFGDSEYGRRILDYYAIEHDLRGDRGV